MNAPLDRARRSLLGLSVGDAFGQRFFLGLPWADLEALIAARPFPRTPWHTTDDTEMAQALLEVLEARGSVDRDLLAATFVRRFRARPSRGYGPGAIGLLEALAAGGDWRDEARSMFAGQGSFGNGGAMRVAPLGAWFADDLAAVVREAQASAEPTHAHPEGQAGAIAVAVAAAGAVQGHPDLLALALEHTPSGETADGIARAMALPRDASVVLAASALGSGQRVSAMDTVPFALWCAQRHRTDYVEALWTTVAGLGDRDTTCAIVGGIVAAGGVVVPTEWIEAREPLVPTAELTVGS